MIHRALLVSILHAGNQTWQDSNNTIAQNVQEYKTLFSMLARGQA
jgi:hypothetical protein